MRLIYIALLVVTGALYLAMVLWSLPLIKLEADGLWPYDLRPLGYSLGAAEEFNNALSDEGRVFYLETQHQLDTVFPGLLAITLVWTVALLWDGVARWGLAALALVAAIADYRENATVARLLEEFEPALALEASRWTQIKSASVSVVLLAILLALGLRLWRRYRA